MPDTGRPAAMDPYPRGAGRGQATSANTKSAMRIEPDGIQVPSDLGTEDGSSRPHMEQLVK